MIKVLYLTYDGLLEPLGKSQVLSYLEFLSKEHEIYVLSFEKKSDWRESSNLLKTRSRGDKAGISWSPAFYHKSFLGTLYDIAAGIFFGIYITYKFKVNILHARSYLPSLIALVIKKLFGVKFIFDMRGLWADEKIDSGIWKENGILYKTTKKLEKIFLLKADRIVSLTESAVEEIKSFSYLKGKEINFSVIRTCTDLELFTPVEASIKSSKSFRLGYVGSVSLWYLFEETLKFFEFFNKEITNSELHIINKNEHKYINNLLTQYPLLKKNIILESLDHREVADCMKQMDAGIFFIKPFYSKKASSPTKLGEFLATGLPCITNKGIGDMDTILEAEKVGITLENFSNESIEKGIIDLLALKEEETLSKRCRNTARRYFSLEKGAKEYSKIYKSFSF